jgi:hypothetical protein
VFAGATARTVYWIADPGGTHLSSQEVALTTVL